MKNEHFQKDGQRHGMPPGSGTSGVPGTARIDFWKDGKAGAIDARLFSTRAEEMAKKIAGDNRQMSKVNKRTQIRKFYDEVLRLSAIAQDRSGHWEKTVLPQVHMLTAKAAYAKGRELVSDTFLDFIRHSVDQVRTPEDLKVFSDFFEAFMGFYRLHGPNN